jgi:transposase-like protein
MPYKFETSKMKISKSDDKRRKLSDEDKEEIRYRYLKVGGVSQGELAREYNVSRRSIVFAIYPEKREENYRQRVARGGSKQYYDKDKQREYSKTHRQDKKKLYDDGKLIENSSTV